ncbi:copper chaperone [Paraburkholderia terricola]|jgi:copper chaperone|nr:copper chaperone [Paraburkholderia terricola]
MRRARLLDFTVVGRFKLSVLFDYRSKKMEFQVKDMSCGGCANSITRAVTHADPAAKLEIDVAAKVVKIDSALPPERLLAVIEEAGFHPTLGA